MGAILGKCFGGGEEPARTLSSAATDVTEALVSAHESFGEEPTQTSSSATDVTESFVYMVTPKRFNLDHDTLGNVDELKLELSNNPQLGSIIVEYLRTSIYTDDFFSSIDECLKESKSSADLLFEAVNHFENREPSSSVLQRLQQFKAQGNPLCQPCIDKFRSQRAHHFARIQNLSKLVKHLDGKLGKVASWKIVGSSVYTVATIGLLIGSAVLVIMSNRQVNMQDFDPGHKAIARLDTDMNVILDEYKSSLKGKRDTIVELLNPAIDELDNIKVLMRQTSRAIEELNSVKMRVHEHVEVYIKSAHENARFGTERGNDEEENRYMSTAMHGIETEAKLLKKIVEDLKKEVNQRRDELSTAVATILKAVEKNNNEFVCCCCCCCC